MKPCLSGSVLLKEVIAPKLPETHSTSHPSHGCMTKLAGCLRTGCACTSLSRSVADTKPSFCHSVSISGSSAGRQASRRLSITQKSKPCRHKEGAPQLHAPLLCRHAVPNFMHSCTDSQLLSGTACLPTSSQLSLLSLSACNHRLAVAPLSSSLHTCTPKAGASRHRDDEAHQEIQCVKLA